MVLALINNFGILKMKSVFISLCSQDHWCSWLIAPQTCTRTLYHYSVPDHPSHFVSPVQTCSLLVTADFEDGTSMNNTVSTRSRGIYHISPSFCADFEKAKQHSMKISFFSFSQFLLERECKCRFCHRCSVGKLLETVY